MKAPHGSRSLRVALVCGALPLLAGSLAFAGWWIWRDDRAAVAGVVTIFGGTALFCVGTVALIVAARSRRPVQRRSLIAAGSLLLLNFPTACVYERLVSREVTENRIAFENRTGEVVHDLRLLHRERQMGARERLEPGERAEFAFSALGSTGEGMLTFEARVGASRIGGETGLVVFVFTKGHADITLLPGGRYRVTLQGFETGLPAGPPETSERGPSATDGAAGG